MIHRRGTRQHRLRLSAWARSCGCIPVMALATASSAFASATPPATITSLAVFRSITNDQAALAIPVAFEATVAYHIKGSIGLFVQDGPYAIYADAPENAILTPGDRVLVRGKTHIGFRPEIRAESVTVVGHTAVPSSIPAGYTQLVRGDLDCVRVTAHGKVRSADLVTYGKETSIYLELAMDGGFINAILNSSDAGLPEKLRGAEVDVTGSTSGKFDSKSQLTGIVLKVFTASDVKILEEPHSSPEALPFTPMDQILQHSYVQDLSERVRVEGTVTYYLPGSAVVLQNGARSLWIQTKDQQPLTIGDHAFASGYPEVGDGRLTLAAAEIEDSDQQSPIKPLKIGWDELSSGANAYNLISVEGQVLKEDRKEYQDEYVITTEGHLFSVVFRHTDEDLGFDLPSMKSVPVGTRVRVTGIQSVSYGSNPFEGPAGFDLLLRSFDDIEVLARPPLFNVGNLTRLIEILLAVIFIIGVRIIWTERKARLRNATVADLERRRGKILEAINSSRSLPEILESINDLVSVRLGTVPTWIVLSDGTTQGVPKMSTSALRIVEEAIPSRSGTPLGTIHAAFGAQTRRGEDEAAALIQAAGLAKLAIETSQLYSDLIYRSDFDLLTGSHNRFSFEKQIDHAIERARLSTSICGLLYIDLNDFKQVNDQFGHHTGDLYLQEVALRMKEQLRQGDILARQGGDEFAVILPRVRSLADVEEITSRLEQCFRKPFVWDNCTVHGSASIGIATYPADGTTRDSLLSSADAAMYVMKQTKRREKESLSRRHVVR